MMADRHISAVAGTASATGLSCHHPCPLQEGWAATRSTGSGTVLINFGGQRVEIPFAPGSGLSIIADARIDNAADLCRELGLCGDLPAEWVIAAAYCRWQDDCPAHLEGDFAFAIWDSRKQTLLCARDRAGVRPLYYIEAGQALHVAQSPGALAKALRINLALRDEAVADYLYGRVIDAEGTLFTGVKRLQPGHVMLAEGGALKFRRYYELTPAAPAGTDVREEFRHLLDQAVRKRAGGIGQVGALLSGGLDSSAIACLLREQHRANGAAQVPTFSMVFREPDRSNERPFVDQVLARGGFSSQVFELDDYRPLDGMETLLEACDGPTHAPNLACMRHVVGAAANSGIGVLLDGHGGDEVVSHGYGLLSELAARGAWLKLWREARGAADNYGRSSLALIRRLAARQTGFEAKLVARALAPFDRPQHCEQQSPPHLLSRDLIDRSAFRDRLRSFIRPEAAIGEQEQHRAVLTSALQPYAFEVHAAFYRSMGVEARYPFWDMRLVEFCLGLPAHEKLANGWSRLVLRRAMKGIVPEQVLARRDKVDFTIHLARGLAKHHRSRIEALFAPSPGNALAHYCDLAAARTVFGAICADPDAAPGKLVQMVWRAAALGIWLEMRGTSAAVQQSHPPTQGVEA